MLQLTPFRETENYKAALQESLQEEHVAILTRQIQKKFALSPEISAAINADLQQLDLAMLRTLLDLIFDINSIEQPETWISSHLPRQVR